jgi:hypothetical protein
MTVNHKVSGSSPLSRVIKFNKVYLGFNKVYLGFNKVYLGFNKKLTKGPVAQLVEHSSYVCNNNKTAKGFGIMPQLVHFIYL